MENEYHKAVKRIADHVLHQARQQATVLSNAMGSPESKVLSDVLDAVQDNRPIAVQFEHDKRAHYWRVRLRLFENATGSLEADSDPETQDDASGSAVVRSLPGVLEWAGDLLSSFHAARGERAVWLDNATAQQKIKSFRPSLSRGHGGAPWRIEYLVDSRPWRAQIDTRQEKG